MMPIVGDAYYRYEYMRLWWPNQDYFRVTADGVLNAIVNGQMRRAVFDIWLAKKRLSLSPKWWKMAPRDFWVASSNRRTVAPS